MLALALVGCVDKKWEAFKVAHRCKVVARADGTIATGFTSSGKVATVFNASTTSWLCDDGVTYTKED